MYKDIYKIEGTLNLDQHQCYNDPNTFPEFQKGLEIFKDHMMHLVFENEDMRGRTFYKFGDGDYYFLTKQSVGSATPGQRALSVPYNKINHNEFVKGVLLNDFYTCEIYPENISRFNEVIKKDISYPAEYSYGLVANKWFLKKFSGNIGLIGASEKIYLIEELMKYDEYKEYLGLDSFNDYIHFPQKYACDDIESVEKFVGEQLKNSSSKIFLLGIGHSKSALLYRFKKYIDAVFMDVGAGIDMIAGCINIKRPFAGDWTNYRIEEYDYSKIDYLRYSGEGKHIFLK